MPGLALSLPPPSAAAPSLADLMESPADRQAVRGFQSHAGAQVLVPQRWVPDSWLCSPAEVADRLNRCGSDAVLGDGPQGLTAQPMHCRQSCCPVCARAAAGRRTQAAERILRRLTVAGYQLAHLTLTQPAVPHGRASEAGLTADLGETLPAALERWRRQFRALRDSRRTRPAWTGAAVGYVWGMEWTESSGRHYHAHGHVLVVLPPEVDVEAAMGSLVDAWLATGVGADLRKSKGGQHWRRVEPSAVAEVLKYPFKGQEMSDVGLLSWLACVRGRRLHGCGGILHGSSVAARMAKVLQEAEPGPLTPGSIPGSVFPAMAGCMRKSTGSDDYRAVLNAQVAHALALAGRLPVQQAQEGHTADDDDRWRPVVVQDEPPGTWDLDLGPQLEPTTGTNLGSVLARPEHEEVWVQRWYRGEWGWAETTPAQLLSELRATAAVCAAATTASAEARTAERTARRERHGGGVWDASASLGDL